MKKFIKEFKEFAMKGNVIDMAVGVVVGGAFSKIVTALVNNIITPCIGLLTGGTDLADLKYVLKAAELAEDGVTVVTPENAILYGSFIQTIIDFFIIALSIFIVIKIIGKVNAKVNAKKIAEEEAKKAEEAAKPKPPTTEELLTDILAELKNK